MLKRFLRLFKKNWHDQPKRQWFKTDKRKEPVSEMPVYTKPYSYGRFLQEWDQAEVRKIPIDPETGRMQKVSG